jgi:hypothetical protein
MRAALRSPVAKNEGFAQGTNATALWQCLVPVFSVLGGDSQCSRRSFRLVLSYTRHWLGERSPLGRAAALLAGCP